MASLRKMLDSFGALKLGVSQQVNQGHEFKLNDQAVIRRTVTRGRSPHTSEVIVGQIAAFSDDHKTATLSIPRPGGITQRTEVPISELSPVSQEFRRSSVQFNPAYRQINLSR